MKYFTYILLCSNNKYYTGHTDSIPQRFNRHLLKQGAKFTKQNKPVKVVWYQKFDNELDAIKREKQLKGWSKTKKEKLIKGIWK